MTRVRIPVGSLDSPEKLSALVAEAHRRFKNITTLKIEGRYGDNTKTYNEAGRMVGRGNEEKKPLVQWFADAIKDYKDITELDLSCFYSYNSYLRFDSCVSEDESQRKSKKNPEKLLEAFGNFRSDLHITFCESKCSQEFFEACFAYAHTDRKNQDVFCEIYGYATSLSSTRGLQFDTALYYLKELNKPNVDAERIRENVRSLWNNGEELLTGVEVALITTMISAIGGVFAGMSGVMIYGIVAAAIVSANPVTGLVVFGMMLIASGMVVIGAIIGGATTYLNQRKISRKITSETEAYRREANKTEGADYSTAAQVAKKLKESVALDPGCDANPSLRESNANASTESKERMSDTSASVLLSARAGTSFLDEEQTEVNDTRDYDLKDHASALRQ